MEEQKQQECTTQTQELLELGASTTKSSRGNIYTLTIIGQIEGHQVLPETVKTTKYEHVIHCWRRWRSRRRLTGCCCF